MVMLDDIPPFLIRGKRRGRPRKIIETFNDGFLAVYAEIEAKHQRWNEIKEKKYGTRYEMYLGDQVPKFGCGLRSFHAKEGRKWVHLTKHLGDPNNLSNRIRTKLLMSQWNDMKRQHQVYLRRNKLNET
jgi:hypothetical protein